MAELDPRIRSRPRVQSVQVTDIPISRKKIGLVENRKEWIPLEGRNLLVGGAKF